MDNENMEHINFEIFLRYKKLNNEICKELMDIETILICVVTQNRSFIWGGGK